MPSTIKRPDRCPKCGLIATTEVHTSEKREYVCHGCDFSWPLAEDKLWYEEFKKIIVQHDYLEIGDIQIPIYIARDLLEQLLKEEELSESHRQKYSYQKNYASFKIVKFDTHGKKIEIKISRTR